MRKDRRPKPKEDATSVEGFSRTSDVSKSTKANPSAKSSASNAKHLSLHRETSLSFVRKFVSWWRKTRARRQTTASLTSLLNLLRAQEESVNLKVQETLRGNHT